MQGRDELAPVLASTGTTQVCSLALFTFQTRSAPKAQTVTLCLPKAKKKIKITVSGLRAEEGCKHKVNMRCDSMPDLYASLWQRNEGQGSPPSSLSFGDPAHTLLDNMARVTSVVRQECEYKYGGIKCL